ncbi:alpha/beta hydrolase [Streptomyces sp. NBC_00963]|uniref:alpha/beta hydrolase n=1 Tax=Streptomyces sp. NBC_00963 TaxID=2903697 RepID=UPI00386AC3F7|nr:alpha/beta hydrolase [Streptomyces sp. NBC_00963]
MTRPYTEFTETFAAADGTQLPLHVFAPQGEARAALLLFHGGGWMIGSPAMFFPQAKALAQAGILTASAGYRLIGAGADSPLDCMADTEIADHLFRTIAADAGLATISVGGGSAGGQLALSLAASPARHYDSLVLFNPALDACCEGAAIAQLLKVTPQQARAFSPLHHVRPGMPPAVMFHGTDDQLVPITLARRFRQLMTDTGTECELVEFPGVGHGFFNHDPNGNSAYHTVLARTQAYLLRTSGE